MFFRCLGQVSAPWGESTPLQRGHKERERRFGGAALTPPWYCCLSACFAVFPGDC